MVLTTGPEVTVTEVAIVATLPGALNVLDA